jgi:hypothetical protein
MHHNNVVCQQLTVEAVQAVNSGTKSHVTARNRRFETCLLTKEVMK